MPRQDIPEEASEQNRVAGEGNITRRRLLELGGTATVVGVAGCLSDGDGGAGNQSTSSVFNAHFGRAKPSEVHFNMFNPTGTLTEGHNSPQQVLWDSLMQYNVETKKWTNRLLSDFSVDGTTVTLKIDSAYSWANGDPVRAQDLVTQLRIAKYIEYPIWNIITEANAADERTAELTLAKESNAKIVRQLTNRTLYVKHSEYKQWLEDFDKASTTEQENDVAAELQKWEYAPVGSGKKPATNGPYKIDNIGSTKITLTRNENYPVNTNIPTYEFEYLPNNSDSATIADKLDGLAMGAPKKQVSDKYPDHFKKVEIPEFGASALHIQHDHEMLGNKHVRQAIAYLADTKRVAENSNPRIRPLKTTAWMSESQAQNWLGDQHNAYTQYGPEAKPDKAAAKMEQAGFTKEGGTWTDSNGKSYSFQIQTPDWGAPLAVAQTLADQLSDFGIEASVRQLEASAWISNYESGDFTLRGGYFGGGPHPYSAYSSFTGTTMQAANIPMQVELPPIGNPSGQTSSFDVAKNITSLVTTLEEEKSKQIASKLAWYINQFLPGIPLTNGVVLSWYTTDEWTFPSPDEDASMYLTHPINQMLKESKEGSDQAKLQAKTK